MREASGDQTERFAELAATLAERSPQQLLEDLGRLRAESAALSGAWPPSGLHRLAREVAARVDDPLGWGRALVDAGFDRIAAPFVDRLVRERPRGWQGVWAAAVEHESLRLDATSVALRCEPLPISAERRLSRSLLEHPSQAARLVEDLSLGGRIPLFRLAGLLAHPDDRIAFAAAIGEWVCRPRGTVRPELSDAWRGAILANADLSQESRATVVESHQMRNYWLREILAAEPELAEEWLRRGLARKPLPYWLSPDDPAGYACRALSPDQRTGLLGEAGSVEAPHSLVGLLVGDDLAVFHAAIRIERLGHRRLEPLYRTPDATWRELAAAARQAGFSPNEIVGATVSRVGINETVGSGRERWEHLHDAVCALMERERDGIVMDVLCCLRDYLGEEIQRSLAKEQRWALAGLGR